RRRLPSFISSASSAFSCCRRRKAAYSPNSETTIMRVPRTTIEPGGHIAFEIESGQRLTIVQPLGEQVADLISFTRDDPRERLSMLASRATQLSYKLTKGHKLYSSRTREMWDIEEDLTGENYCGGGYCSRHL